MAFHCSIIIIYFFLLGGSKCSLPNFPLGSLLLIYMDTHNFKAKCGMPMTMLSDFPDSDPFPVNPHFSGEDPTWGLKDPPSFSYMDTCQSVLHAFHIHRQD